MASTHTHTSTTYTKLRDGSWGLRGAGLTAGAAVHVTKRDGSTKTETVGRILWEGNGVQLATIARADRSAGASSRGGSCDECGRASARLVACYDSSGIAGSCCPRCAATSRYERSFA